MNRKLPLAIAISALLSSAALYAAEPGPGREDTAPGTTQNQGSDSMSKDAMGSGAQSESTDSSAMQSDTAKIKQTVSDTKVTGEVKSKLLADSDTSGLKIHVTTKSGVVTLNGKVKSAEEKSKAEEIARAVSGVKTVRNHLAVSSQS